MEIQPDTSQPEVKQIGDHDSGDYLNQCHGFWLTPIFVQATEELLKQFKPLPNDVILASFPKTGTTWLKSLLYSIVNHSSIDQLTRNHPHELVPQLELLVYGPHVVSPHPFPSLDTSSSNRIFSTHLPYQIFGKTVNSSDCRVVYVARNPKDTLVSSWHFYNSMEMFKTSPWPLEVTVDNFCKGKVPFGPYYDHVLGYHKESLERPKKFFFITYEELKSDPKTHVKKLAEFLGYPFDNKEQVEEVVRNCSIETLRNHEVNKSSDLFTVYEFPYNSFFRKGQVGDHRNYLTKDMIDRVDTITREKFQGSIFNHEEDSKRSKDVAVPKDIYMGLKYHGFCTWLNGTFYRSIVALRMGDEVAMQYQSLFWCPNIACDSRLTFIYLVMIKQ
ncbi:cytosolic sulfotransferase 5-like [Rhododendron vialii]|uniref:cytosolic sulfotransferase 5-like n=1 Tax=Rhododendron vialii TaxID=182163 RepID=UPI00265E9A81|nr:cytosolic sulfotransferase 5-like [Rhododendron vialii]